MLAKHLLRLLPVVLLVSQPVLGKDKPPPVVEVITVAGGDAIVQNLQAVATLRANESLILKPEVGGRVTAIGFEEGQAVAKGQLLVKLNDDVLQAELAGSQATLALAQAEAQRYQALFAEKQVAELDFERKKAELAQARAALALLQARLRQTEIRAPFAGVAGLRQFSPGDVVQPGQGLVNINSLSPLKADIRLPESRALQVRLGQTVSFSLPSVPGLTMAGKVVAIEPALDGASRAMIVRAQIPKGDSRLRAGMTAQAAFSLPAAANAGVVVPESALVAQAGKWVVFKVTGKMASATPVQTGVRSPGKVTITEGIKAGDVIVVSGQNKLPMPKMPIVPAPYQGAP